MESERYDRGEGRMMAAGIGGALPEKGRYENVAKAVRESGVQAELDEMRQVLHVHAETIQALAGRLTPILLDVPTSPGTDAQTRTPDRHLCGVGESIRTLRRELEAMTFALREITKRADV